MARVRNEGSLVFSTEHGRMCAACGRPAAECACETTDAQPTGDGIVRVRRERKGRGGKVVTVVAGVPLRAAELASFAQALRRQLSVGGSVKGAEIELQGDHGERVVERLRARGWQVKHSGG